MCLEDVAIGMSMTKERRNVSLTLAGGVQQLLAADELRQSFVIATDGVAVIWIDNSPDVAVGTGLPIKTTDMPQQFLVKDFGDCVRNGLWGITANVAAVNVGMLTSSLVPEKLDESKARLAQLMRQP